MGAPYVSAFLWRIGVWRAGKDLEGVGFHANTIVACYWGSDKPQDGW
jgi:uncharacterized membrane protein YiaA